MIEISKFNKLSKDMFLIAILCIVTISMVGVVSASAVIAEPTVTKTASPTSINIAGSGSNEITTVTIEVTGAGSATTTSVPMDVIFAIDSSGSMGYSYGDPNNLRLDAAKAFLDKMDSTKDTAGVVSWDSNIDFSEALTNDFAYLKTRIDAVDHSGGTNLNVGLTESINLLNANARSGSSAEIIIFLSDGSGSYSHDTAVAAATAGYTIYSIGLGSSVDTAGLMDMATTTGGAYYPAPTAANLDAIYQDIYSEVAASTIPYNVDVIEITQAYIVDEGSFNVIPDSIYEDPITGTTTITWLNIGELSDKDPDMSADETVTLTFEAKCNQIGIDLPVDVVPDAIVNYDDGEGNDAGFVNIPQAYITVGQNIPPNEEEIPEFPTVAIPMIAIVGLAFVFSKRE